MHIIGFGIKNSYTFINYHCLLIILVIFLFHATNITYARCCSNQTMNDYT